MLDRVNATTFAENATDERRSTGRRVKRAVSQKFESIVGDQSRLNQMREYLEATQLSSFPAEYAAHYNRGPLPLDLECKILLAELTIGKPIHITALDDRFRIFQANYVRSYRLAHERWCEEIRELQGALGDLLAETEALRNLNAVSALDPTPDPDIFAQVAKMGNDVIPCNIGAALAPEVTPCCPRCGYVLGATSARKDLEALSGQVRRALHRKLATLARRVIAEIIRRHQHGDELEGFLKILQAAQIYTLIPVLDETLARYISRVLEQSSNKAELFSLTATPTISLRRVASA